MSRIPHMSKRRNIKALTHALAIHALYGPPNNSENAIAFPARHESWCIACATMIDPGVLITRKDWFDHHGIRTFGIFMHTQCPSPFTILTDNLEEHDDLVVVRVHLDMQGGRCFSCDALLKDSIGYLAYSKQHTTPEWHCVSCVAR